MGKADRFYSLSERLVFFTPKRAPEGLFTEIL